MNIDSNWFRRALRNHIPLDRVFLRNEDQIFDDFLAMVDSWDPLPLATIKEPFGYDLRKNKRLPLSLEFTPSSDLLQFMIGESIKELENTFRRPINREATEGSDIEGVPLVLSYKNVFAAGVASALIKAKSHCILSVIQSSGTGKTFSATQLPQLLCEKRFIGRVEYDRPQPYHVIYLSGLEGSPGSCPVMELFKNTISSPEYKENPNRISVLSLLAAASVLFVTNFYCYKNEVEDPDLWFNISTSLHVRQCALELFKKLIVIFEDYEVSSRTFPCVVYFDEAAYFIDKISRETFARIRYGYEAYAGSVVLCSTNASALKFSIGGTEASAFTEPANRISIFPKVWVPLSVVKDYGDSLKDGDKVKKLIKKDPSVFVGRPLWLSAAHNCGDPDRGVSGALEVALFKLLSRADYPSGTTGDLVEKALKKANENEIELDEIAMQVAVAALCLCPDARSRDSVIRYGMGLQFAPHRDESDDCVVKSTYEDLARCPVLPPLDPVLRRAALLTLKGPFRGTVKKVLSLFSFTPFESMSQHSQGTYGEFMAAFDLVIRCLDDSRCNFRPLNDLFNDGINHGIKYLPSKQREDNQNKYSLPKVCCDGFLDVSLVLKIVNGNCKSTGDILGDISRVGLHTPRNNKAFDFALGGRFPDRRVHIDVKNKRIAKKQKEKEKVDLIMWVGSNVKIKDNKPETSLRADTHDVVLVPICVIAPLIQDTKTFENFLSSEGRGESSPKQGEFCPISLEIKKPQPKGFPIDDFKRVLRNKILESEDGELEYVTLNRIFRNEMPVASARFLPSYRFKDYMSWLPKDEFAICSNRQKTQNYVSVNGGRSYVNSAGQQIFSKDLNKLTRRNILRDEGFVGE